MALGVCMNEPNQRRVRLMDRSSWEARYATGPLPWDSGEVDTHLISVVEAHHLQPCPALEIGCGTGTNAIWLAKRGFQVTGTDLAQNAIDKARAKVATAGVQCALRIGDFLVDEPPGGPFGFIYDRGCFHVFQADEARARFAARVAGLLTPQGIWHSLVGSTDGPPREAGPPRVSASEIITALEPHFEIIELRSTHFAPEGEAHARAWVVVARRRTIYPG